MALTSKGALAVAVLVTLAAAKARPACAEPADGTHLFAIEVAGTPEGLRGAAGVSAPTATQAEMFLDLIERLYFLAGSPSGVEHYASTVASVMNEWRRARRRDGTVSLEAVREDSRARDRLEELLEAAGFLLLRNSGRLFVRPGPDSEDRARREALAAAGLAVADLDARMNGGEAVVFEFPSFEIPSALLPEVWRTAIFDREAPGERLGFRLLTDRRAAFLHYGLLSMTPETVQFLAANPKLLRELYERDAMGVAAYGRSFVVEDGRVVVPGGGRARGLWQRVVGESPDEPDEFLKAVLRHGDGVLGFLYDAIAHLDEPSQRFTLSLWLPYREQRPNFERLYRVTAAHIQFAPDRPWTRGFQEPSVLLSQVATDDTGRPLGPVWTELWKNALSDVELPQNAAREIRNVQRSEPIDASRLVEYVFDDPDWIAARTAAFVFAQRRFADVERSDLRHVLITLRGFPLFGSLVSTLDRMGVESPRTYATAVGHAARLNGMSDPDGARDAMSQFQGVIALLDRVRRVRSLSAAAAADLVASAAAVRLNENRGYEGRMAAWFAGELLPALGAGPPADVSGDSTAGMDVDSGSAPGERIVLQALAGALEDDGRGQRETTTWEGFAYVADLRGATLARLLEVREAQSGASLDAALDLWAIADTLASGPETVEEVERQAQLLRSAARAVPARPGPVSVIVSHVLGRVYSGLDRVRVADDISRHVPEAARELHRLSDAVFGDVLRALVYAFQVGDPRSGVLASGDLSVRHDFGLDPAAGDALRATAWQLPTAHLLPDRPWYAEGALLGLELATADLRLQQITTSLPPVASALATWERAGLAASVALFNAFDRRQAEIEEIAGAVEAGRRRTVRLAESPGEAPAVAAAAGLRGWRRALLGWITHREPHRLEDWLSVREFLWVGFREAEANGDGSETGKVTERLRGWGAYAGPIDGCLCLRLAPPELQWESWRGRAGRGLLSAVAADLALWVAEGLATHGLPVSLGGSVLEVAMRHMLDRVQPSHVEDWNTVLRYASTLRDADFEDYVSSLTGTAFLRPADDLSPLGQAAVARGRRLP